MLHIKRRTIAILLSLAVSITTCIYTPNLKIPANNAVFASSYEEKEKEYQSKYQSLQEKAKQAQKELENAKAELANAREASKEAAEIQRLINNQLEATKNNIVVCAEKVELTKLLIDQKQALINEQEVYMMEQYDLLKKRLRSMYMKENQSIIGLLTGTDSFFDFLYKATAISNVTKHDTNLIKKYTEAHERMINEQAKIDEIFQIYEADLQILEAEKFELAKEFDNATQNLADSINEEVEKELEYEEKIKILEQTRKEIDNVFAQLESLKQQYSSSAFVYPLSPQFKTYTSSFGWRELYGRQDYHTGLDISGAGIYGTPIYAAASGQVVFTQYSNYGYGNYLIIDHGSNLKTLYAHCASLTVSNGQTVKAGDKIATVGSTGNSTGAHLHFEVRLNNTPQNPLNYLGKSKEEIEKMLGIKIPSTTPSESVNDDDDDDDDDDNITDDDNDNITGDDDDDNTPTDHNASQY